MLVECPQCQKAIDSAVPPQGRCTVRCQFCGHELAPLLTSFSMQIDSSAKAKTFQLYGPAVGMGTESGGGATAKPAGSASSKEQASASNPADTAFPPRRSFAKPAPPDVALSAPEVKVSGPAVPPEQVPGYRIESTLGYGGMGTVYLARQLSLDRLVALKVMSRDWSKDVVFSARFTREAFAAAMLNHPNVVQIYDVGDVDGYRYFSMEYVAGRSLADVVRQHGKLDPETAVGYILQAARGLKHAHDCGLIHRDVKPDNLLLNEQGIIKVADLGLVKTPRVHESDRVTLHDTDTFEHNKSAEPHANLSMTGTRMALGTPAFMAPEQCRDAASVDHRADIYSLGCTLYVLLTGRPPFEGRNAVEFMTKHAYEPLVPPELIVGRISKELSTILQTMMAKHVEDRYSSMAEVIRTLEQWLGIHHAGTFSPRDDQIDQLEACVYQFNYAPTAVLKQRLINSAASAVVLVALLLMFFGKLEWAFGLAGLVLQSALAYFVVQGLATKTYFFRRVRQFLFSFTAWDAILFLAGFGLFALLLWSQGIFWLWVGFGLIGIALAGLVRLAFDRAIEAEREDSLKQGTTLLRRMRLQGLDEEELRHFTAKYAGKHWEEFFEALFGYEAKLRTRALLLRGGSAGTREVYAAWREPILNFINRVEKSRKEQRERKMLAEAERQRLLAAGMDSSMAKQEAAQTADAFMEDVLEQRGSAIQRGILGKDQQRPFVRATSSELNLNEFLAKHGRKQRFGLSTQPGERDWLGWLLFVLVGPPIRASLGIGLLFSCLLWAAQNQCFIGLSLADTAVVAPQAMLLPGVPAEYTKWADSANIGWAGTLMIASLFFRGSRMGILATLGAAICAFGHHHGIRTVEPIRDYHAAMILGTILALVGFRLGRR